MDYGKAQDDASIDAGLDPTYNFAYREDGLLYGSLPALNFGVLGTDTLETGFTWEQYRTARDLTQGLFIDGQSYDGLCVYREQPDPTSAPTTVPVPAPTPRPTQTPFQLAEGETAKPTPKPTPQPTEANTMVEVASSVVMQIDKDEFNAKTEMKTVFRKTIATVVQQPTMCPNGVDDWETCTTEPVARDVDGRRRRLLSATAAIDFNMVAEVEGSSGATTEANDILADTSAALTSAVSDGSFSTTLQTTAAAESTDSASDWAAVTVDVTASTAAIADSSVAITVLTPVPTADPTAAPTITPLPTLAPPSKSGGDDDDDGSMVIIIVVVVLVVVLAAGAGAFFMMSKGGAGGAKIQASPA